MLLLLAAAFAAAFLIVQISFSRPSDPAGDSGPLVEQAGSISSESIAAPDPEPGQGAAASSAAASTGSSGTSSGPEAGFASDAGNTVFLSDNPATDSAPENGNSPPPDRPGPITGILSGMVIDAASPGNTPIPRITVYLAGADGVFTGATSRTGDTGRFIFNGLAPGDYKIYFFDLAGTWKAAWHGASTTPAGDAVNVAAGGQADVLQEMKRVDPEDGSISGKVTDTIGNGLPGVDVMAYFLDGAGAGSLMLRGTAVTDSAGHYDVTGLPTDSAAGGGNASGYMIRFMPSDGKYIDQWYDGQATHLTAKLLQLKTAEKIDGIDAVLKDEATDTGGVTLAADVPAPLEPVTLLTEPASLTPESAAFSTEPEALSTEPAPLSTEPEALSTEPAALSTEPGTLSTELASSSTSDDPETPPTH